MKKILTLTLFLCAINSFAQRTEGNQENGEFLKYNANDHLRERMNYKDGQLHGLYEKYSMVKEELMVTERGYYTNGKKDSLWTRFHFGTTQPMTVTHYKNGDKNGVEKQYNKDGVVTLESHFKDNQLNGPWKRFYDNGVLRDEATMENGKEVGERRSYYESGALQSLTHPFIDGLTEWMWFYENGNLKFIKTVKGRNKVHGLLRTFHENGLLQAQEEFVDGVRNGLSMTFDENGNKTQEGHYENRKKVGVWNYYHEGCLESTKDHSEE